MWELVERTGWTLDYIDSLPLAKVYEYEQIKDGRAKGQTRDKGEQVA